MPRHLRNQRFTIIEMIWVIVVIAIILGMGAAAMTGINTNKGSAGGVRMVARLLGLTRQYAISQNTRVALIFCQADQMVKFGELKPDLTDKDQIVNATPGQPTKDSILGVLMRPAIVEHDGTFIEWVPDSKYVVLPSSIYWSIVNGSDLEDVDYIKPISETERVVNDTKLKAIIFKGNGATTQSSDPSLWIKPFSTSSTSTSVEYEPGTANVYNIKVSWLTGRVTTVKWKKIGGSWRTVNE